MKAIFVIQGEGRGHLTQAIAMKTILEHNGHKVVDVLVGKSKMREIPGFFREKMGMDITTFDSPNFLPSKDKRKFSLVSSTAYNMLFTPCYLSSMWLIRQHVKQSDADIIINFYEILCGLTCRLFQLRVPEVCVAHQYMFLHPDFKMPGREKTAEFFLKFFTRATAFGATAKLALSIRQYADRREEGITVVPPLLRHEAKTALHYHGDYVMGYMLNPGFYDDIMAWHREHPHTPLHFFWDKKGAPAELRIDDTLTFHSIDDQKFLKYMAGCKAFATTAGFESVCEALYMGKPTLLLPVHVEQQCNATDAEREMVGVKSDDFDISRLLEFSRGYEEDVEFRMWENEADRRIMQSILNIYNNYYKENTAHEEDDSIIPVAPRPILAGNIWQG